MRCQLLNQSQAEAVYNAMCHLNNVGALLETVMMGRGLIVTLKQWDHGPIVINEGDQREFHADQLAFATAYGLTGD